MSTPSPRPRPNDRHGFEGAIICALPLEADAIEASFDYCWDGSGPPFGKALRDPNSYSTGVIGCHNVVLVRMPGMGKVHAAAAASSCRASFSNVKIALAVGVCGVVPFKRNGEEIVLGDVVISEGIIQYVSDGAYQASLSPKKGRWTLWEDRTRRYVGFWRKPKGSAAVNYWSARWQDTSVPFSRIQSFVPNILALHTTDYLKHPIATLRTRGHANKSGATASSCHDAVFRPRGPVLPLISIPG